MFKRCFGSPGCLADPYSDRLLSILHESNWDVAMKLIRKGEGLRWSNFGWTVLHFAMWKTAPEIIVIAMLKGGLSANERDIEDGKTAVHFAVQFNPKTVSALLEHAGDSNFEDVRENMSYIFQSILTDKSHEQNQGVTPLALAAAKGNVQTLQLLLEAGGDPNRASVGATKCTNALTDELTRIH
jgi:ankyrin repeat protein